MIGFLHFLLTLMRTLMSSMSFPCHLSKGSRSCRRLLEGLTSTWKNKSGSETSPFFKVYMQRLLRVNTKKTTEEEWPGRSRPQLEGAGRCPVPGRSLWMGARHQSEVPAWISLRLGWSGSRSLGWSRGFQRGPLPWQSKINYRAISSETEGCAEVTASLGIHYPVCMSYFISLVMCSWAWTLLDVKPTYLRRGDKSVSSRVSIIPGCEVPVEGSDDGILLSLFHVLPEENNMSHISFI